MGALAALFGIGILALVFKGGGDKGPQPENMIGTPVLRITSGVHVLTITRHAQGYSWYVARGSLVNESGSEGNEEGAFVVGMEALQAVISPSAKIKLAKLTEPQAVIVVEPVGVSEGPWKWTLGPISHQEPSRPEALMAAYNALQGESVEMGGGPAVPEPMRDEHGVLINEQCTKMEVRSLDEWIEVAAPVVLDAIEAGEDTAQGLADAVLGYLLECDTEDLVIDGQGWNSLQLGINTILNNMKADAYVDVAPPEHKLAAAILGKPHTMEGQAGRHLGDVWVVYPDGTWLTFAKTRLPDSEAIATGQEDSVAAAVEAAKDAISQEHTVAFS